MGWSKGSVPESHLQQYLPLLRSCLRFGRQGWRPNLGHVILITNEYLNTCAFLKKHSKKKQLQLGV